MHGSVFFNNGIVPSSEPKLSALSAACLFARGIFTTLAINDGRPFLWEKHWKRIGTSAVRVGIDLAGFSESETRRVLDSLLATNSVHDGRARITFFDQSSVDLWEYESERRTSLLMTTADLRPRPDNFTLTVSQFLTNSASPLSGVKSCNYLEKLLAVGEAKRSGFAEAIQLNERGEVASACMANVFWLTDGRLFTPSLKTGCLAGTTREFLLENFDCDEVEAGIEELRSADEIFLTSAGLGIVQVAEFDGRKLKRDTHPVMRLLPDRS